MIARQILFRVGQAVIVLLLTYSFVFFLLNVLPSDPIALRFAEVVAPGTPEYDQLNAYYGYDRPLWEQYLSQLGQLFQGRLGYSLDDSEPVVTRIAEALPSTEALTSLTLAISVVFALALGLLAFRTWGSWVVKFVRAIPPITSALPVYWTGLVFIQVGSYQWHWFGALDNGSLPSLLAASVSLAIPISAAITQSLVASIGEFAASPFVEVTRARGASPWGVFFRYGLRSVAIPTLTVLAITFGTLMTSTIVTETIFSRNGVGSLIDQAVLGQDIPLVQGIVLFAALLYVGVNLLVDLAALAIDPRLRGLGATRRARPAPVVVYP